MLYNCLRVIDHSIEPKGHLMEKLREKTNSKTNEYMNHHFPDLYFYYIRK